MIPGERGAFLVVSNDLTNTSAEVLDALTAWLIHFRAVQDNGAETPTELTLAALPNKKVAGLVDQQLAESPAGKTTSSAVDRHSASGSAKRGFGSAVCGSVARSADPRPYDAGNSAARLRFTVRVAENFSTV